MRGRINITTRVRVVAVALSLLGLTVAVPIAVGAVPADAAPSQSAVHSVKTSELAPVSAAKPAAAKAAAATVPSCPLGAVCGWTGVNYTGTRGVVYEDNKTLPTIPWHEINSIWNNGAECSVTIYRGTDYDSDGGHEATLYRRTGFYDMKEQLPGLWDHVYSNRWCLSSILAAHVPK